MSLPGEGGGSESSESSDETSCKVESAFVLLFLINNTSDRALVLWCFDAFVLCFLKFKNLPFFVHVLNVKNVQGLLEQKVTQ